MPPPPASVRPAPRRLRPLRAYGAALRVALSYLAFEAVAWVRGPAWAARARPALHRRNGRRVRQRILRLRGLFVKAGQLASVLTGFLPEPFRAELEGLQDQVPAGPLAHVRARIEAELGAPPEALFATFEASPIASASLAQVHRATLADGRAVAVKVQHADIERIARLDLGAIETLLRVAGRLLGIRGLREQFREIEAVILEELDFAREAEHLTGIAAQFADRRYEGAGVGFPTLVPERSARRVLTATFVEGVKASDIPGLRAFGLDPEAVAARLVEAYGQMIFQDGRYHADPHPGNLVVQPDGTLVFLDFGAVARLTPAMRQGLAEMLVGVLRRDAPRVTGALGAMGFVSLDDAGADERTKAVVALVEAVHGRILQGLDPRAFRFADVGLAFAANAQAEAFEQMDALGVSFRDLAGTFRVPRDWVLLERTALLLLGLCTALAPDLNPVRLLWPYVSGLVDDASLDEVAGAGRAALGARLRETARAALGLPLRLDAALERLETGQTAVRTPDVREAAALVYAAGGQIAYAVGASGAGLVAYLAHTHGDAGLAGGLGALSAVCALAFAGSRLRVRPRVRGQP